MASFPVQGETPYGDKVQNYIDAGDAASVTSAQTLVTNHSADTTGVHGIANTADLQTKSGLDSAVAPLVTSGGATATALSGTYVSKPASPNVGDTLVWNGTVWIKSATQFHEGTGNPNGVVAAPVGSKFINTEAGGYNGAREWIKTTGTGTSGWKVTVGDTGWRDVSTLVNGTYWKTHLTGAAASRSLKIRRGPDHVETLLLLDVVTSALFDTLLSVATLPIGFKNTYYTAIAMGLGASSTRIAVQVEVARTI